MKFAVEKVYDLKFFDMNGKDITGIYVYCQKCGTHHIIAQYEWDEAESGSDDTKFIFCEECGKETLHKLEDNNV